MMSLQPLFLGMATIARAGEPQQQLPPGWSDAVAEGSMLVRSLTTSSSSPTLDARLRPTIGNGFVATLAGSANVYIAGVYNLNGTYEPYRARLPGVAAMTLVVPPPSKPPPAVCGIPLPDTRTACGKPPYTPANGCTAALGCCFGSFSPDPRSLPWCYTMANATSKDSCHDKCMVPQRPPKPPANTWADLEALDMQRAAFYQVKKHITLSPTCTVAVEQRSYAHRSRLALLVTDFVIDATNACTSVAAGPPPTVQVAAGAGASPAAKYVQDFNWTVRPPAYALPGVAAVLPNKVSVYAGTTWEHEILGRLVSVAFATAAPLSGTANLAVVPGERAVYTFPTAYTTDVDEPSGVDPSTLAATATASLKAAAAVGSADDLFREHVAAVTTPADGSPRAFIEVEGSLGLAQRINVTLYSLRASLTPAVVWSTSPGGLSTGGRFTADQHDSQPWNQGYSEGGSSYYGGSKSNAPPRLPRKCSRTL